MPPIPATQSYKTREQALNEAKRVPEQAGLVMPFRGKRGYGLRVPSQYSLRGGSSSPFANCSQADAYSCKLLCQVIPITTWRDKQGLRMRPVHHLATNTWLLAASDKVDACHYLWGRSSVLIAPVQSWAQWHSSLGDAPVPAKSFDHLANSRTWSSKTSQSSRPSTSASTSTNSDILTIQTQIRDLTKACKAAQDSEAKLRQDMQSEFIRVRAEIREQIETFEQSVRATLDQRIHCMEKSLQDTNHGMKEGFNAILARLGHPGGEDPAKRVKQNHDMMVEPSSRRLDLAQFNAIIIVHYSSLASQPFVSLSFMGSTYVVCNMNENPFRLVDALSLCLFWLANCSDCMSFTMWFSPPFPWPIRPSSTHLQCRSTFTGSTIGSTFCPLVSTMSKQILAPLSLLFHDIPIGTQVTSFIGSQSSHDVDQGPRSSCEFSNPAASIPTRNCITSDRRPWSSNSSCTDNEQQKTPGRRAHVRLLCFPTSVGRYTTILSNLRAGPGFF